MTRKDIKCKYCLFDKINYKCRKDNLSRHNGIKHKDFIIFLAKEKKFSNENEAIKASFKINANDQLISKYKDFFLNKNLKQLKVSDIFNKTLNELPISKNIQKISIEENNKVDLNNESKRSLEDFECKITNLDEATYISNEFIESEKKEGLSCVETCSNTKILKDKFDFNEYNIDLSSKSIAV